MIDKIKQIIQTHPRHYTKIVFADPFLKQWVETRGDKNSINKATQIYTAITQEKVLCPCGSGKFRKVRRLSEGLSFCGGKKDCIANKMNSYQKSTNSFLQRYGVSNPFQMDEVKNKIKKTNLKKYGSTNPIQTPDVKNKIKNTSRFKYGRENVSQVPTIRAKIRETNLKRYGVENVAKSSEIQKKIEETNLRRYGVKSTLQFSEVQIKIIICSFRSRNYGN